MARPAEEIKRQAHALIDRLPDDASLEETIEHLETWLELLAADAEIEAGNYETNDAIRRRYGLAP